MTKTKSAPPPALSMIRNDRRYLDAERNFERVRREHAAARENIVKYRERDASASPLSYRERVAEAMSLGQPPPPPPDDHSEFGKLLELERTLDLAVEKARKRFEDVVRNLSRELAKVLAPEYRKIVERQAAAARALVSAIREEEAFVGGIEAEGFGLGGLERCVLGSSGEFEALYRNELRYRALEYHGLKLPDC